MSQTRTTRPGLLIGHSFKFELRTKRGSRWRWPRRHRIVGTGPVVPTHARRRRYSTGLVGKWPDVE